MARWIAFPHDGADYTYDTAALKKNWARLHAGDAEPLPKDDKVLAGLARGNAMRIAAADAEPVATSMVVVLTYWLSYEYVRDPRRALEPESAGAALLRGAFHVLSLLMPYLEPAQKEHLLGLVGNYNNP